jgi:NADH-quinone oxidoreductase subunit M
MPLSILIWVPVGMALVAALTPTRVVPRVSLLGALAAFAIALVELSGFHSGGGLQHVTDVIWIPSMGIHYKLGLDGLNLFLILLTTLLFAVSVGWANLRGWDRPRTFYFHLGLAETAVLGVFCVQDLGMFVGFFDLMLIPFYFLCGQWGGRNRVPATMKMIIYTFVASLLMLAAAIATGIIAAQHTGHLDFTYTALRHAHLSGFDQDWIFLLFSAAFLVKMPAFPIHGWMSDAYRAMPLPVLGVFSGVLSKVGAYGFLAICLPLFPQGAHDFQYLLLAVAMASIFYGSAMAFTQRNIRLIVGYSSVAQLGFITLGIFSLRSQGAQGALFQMINHGLVVEALFVIIAVIVARTQGSEDVRDMGGIAVRAPILGAVFVVVAFATLAMPGSPNFVGEFLILLGAFSAHVAVACVAIVGVILAAVYMLRFYIRTMHNRQGPAVSSRDLARGDIVVLAPVVLAILGLAFYPQFQLGRTEHQINTQVAAANQPGVVNVARVRGVSPTGGRFARVRPGSVAVGGTP